MDHVSPERWQRIRRHLDRALELPPEAVTGFLDRLGEAAPDLAEELASLLGAHREAGGFLARPAVRLVAAHPGRGEEGRVGAYRLLRELGRGGMGTVFLAERADDAYRRQVAVKVLRRGLDTSELVGRFDRERRILAALDHPHIARLLDGGSTEEGRRYLVMERVDGLRIDAHCERSGLSLEARLELFRKVCGAVHYAHRHGVIHGDLKPANIVVTAGDEPKLLDFGVARLSRSMAAPGPRDRVTGGAEAPDLARAPLTPDYASPEQLLGEPVTTASDVFQLGILLFELVTGRRPFEPLGDLRGVGREALREALARRRVPRLAAGEGARSYKAFLPDLDDIVHRALARDPARRFPTAGDLAADVGHLLRHEPVESTPPTLGYLLRGLARRHRAFLGAGGAALVLLTAAGATSLYHGWRTERRAALAQRFAQQAQHIESIARLAVLLPAELARLQEGRVRNRLTAIEREVAVIGPEATGPAAYALGVGSYLLAEYESAQAHLERAWQDGFQTPPVARALGNTLGARYRLALQEAERVASPELRREARRQATETFRDPAVRFLQLGRSEDPRTAMLLDASLAFYDGRLEEAAAEARRAFVLVPGLHEAKKLEGDVYREQAARARDETDVSAAVRWHEKAGEAYREAMTLARSDPRLFAAECARRGALAELVHTAGERGGRRFAEAIEICDQALALDPDLAEVLVEKSRLFLERARELLVAAADAEADYAEAERLARAAIEREAASAAAYLQLGHVLLDRAGRRDEQGEDPRPTYRAAEDAMRLATSLNPSRPEAFNGLGTLHWNRAHYLYRQGGDFGAEFRTAIEAFGRSLTLVPRYSRAHNNIGACQLDDAVLRAARGEDATGAFLAGIDSFRQAIEISPDNAVFSSNLGNAHLELGLHLHRLGGDPEPHLAAAMEAYQKAIALGPRHALPWHNLALAEKLRGYLQHSTGKEPVASFRRALCALDEAIGLNPGMVANYVDRASVLLLLARWEVPRGGSPRRLLALADRALDEALRLAPADAHGLATRGEVAWRRARWGSRGAAPLDAGREAVEASLRAYPEYPYAHAIGGALALAAAERAAGPKRRELATAAVRSLERAIELDRYLDSELAALLPEARALARGGTVRRGESDMLNPSRPSP